MKIFSKRNYFFGQILSTKKQCSFSSVNWSWIVKNILIRLTMSQRERERGEERERKSVCERERDNDHVITKKY